MRDRWSRDKYMVERKDVFKDAWRKGWTIG